MSCCSADGFTDRLSDNVHREISELRFVCPLCDDVNKYQRAKTHLKEHDLDMRVAEDFVYISDDIEEEN